MRTNAKIILAKIITSKLTEILTYLSKYKRPQDCEKMYSPNVNAKIWHKMKPFAKKADIKMANLQDTLLKGLFGLAESTSALLTCRKNKLYQTRKT